MAVPSDPFDFFSGPATSAVDLCPADQIFQNGKLLPSKPAPLPPRPPGTEPFDRRRSESLSALERRRRFPEEELRRLRRAASESGSSPRAARLPLPEAAKPVPAKWQLFAFGTTRVPVGMELSDIRSRQRRRSTEAADAAAGSGKGAWKILRVMSCRRAESVAVTAPLSLA